MDIEPENVADLLLEFATPLLQALPRRGRDAAALRSIFGLAEACWNLPVLEASNAASFVCVKRSFDAAVDSMPPMLAALLQQMLRTRKAQLHAVPFSLTVHVEGTSLEDLELAVRKQAHRVFPASGND